MMNLYQSLPTSILTYDFIKRNGSGLLKLNYDLQCERGDKFCITNYKKIRNVERKNESYRKVTNTLSLEYANDFVKSYVDNRVCTDYCRRFNVVVLECFTIDSGLNDGKLIYCYVVESILDQWLMFESE